MKWLLYIVFAAAFLLVTYFGIGPVLMADGSFQERMLTLLVVLIIYVVLIVLLRFLSRKLSRSS